MKYFFFVVCSAINATLNNINFPTDVAELRKAKADFFDIADFPNCVGAVDGTLIPIQGMSGPQEPAFVCRKNFHALNIQAVANSKMRCLFLTLLMLNFNLSFSSFCLIARSLDYNSIIYCLQQTFFHI
jgi:hypothetical protein